MHPHVGRVLALLGQPITSRVISFFYTQPDSRRRAAFGSVRRTTTWAEYRDQGLFFIAAHRSIGLHCAEVRRAGIAFVARLTLRTLWSLRPLLALRASHALNALRPLSFLRGLAVRDHLWDRARDRMQLRIVTS